jgi:hypothetical protein
MMLAFNWNRAQVVIILLRNYFSRQWRVELSVAKNFWVARRRTTGSRSAVAIGSCYFTPKRECGPQPKDQHRGRRAR